MTWGPPPNPSTFLLRFPFRLLGVGGLRKAGAPPVLKQLFLVVWRVFETESQEAQENKNAISTTSTHRTTNTED